MKKKSKRYLVLIVFLYVLSYVWYVNKIDPGEMEETVSRENITVKMEEENQVVTGEITEQKEPDREVNLQLYATSAVLFDVNSNRVLYEKNGSQIMPMASTTKIMTCIVALENADQNDVVTVSAKAASMPNVQLHIREGEEYYLKDLLYSLMLESHNDSAVAIAEHVGGSVEGFAELMNQKARDIGCYDTYFITPNGLDANDGKGSHSTTAVDLAKIMGYCIKTSPKNKEFLEITRTADYSFSDIGGTRSFSCRNHNAFLTMMEGALSGKTGFTAKAGYCYVGSLEQNEKCFAVALLACGWPNNKGYKWSDTRTLMNYGLENYEFKAFDDVKIEEEKLEPIHVLSGQTDKIDEKAYTGIEVKDTGTTEGLLLRKDETMEVTWELKENLEAPVEKGIEVGSIKYMVNGELLKENRILTLDAIEAIDYRWCFEKVIEKVLF